MHEQLQRIKNSLNSYGKPHTSFEEQIGLLKKRGLTVNNEAYALNKLSQIGYYRLSAYFHPFEQAKDVFTPGTTFEEIISVCDFDSRLRGLLFRAIETIEVFVRTQITHWHSKAFGPLGYMEKANFHPSASQDAFDKLQQSIREEVDRSDATELKKHFKNKYQTSDLPVWAMIEQTSFGTLSRLYTLLPSEQQKNVVKKFPRIENSVFQNWLHALTIVRNICAHHGRLWDKELRISFLVPKRHSFFRDSKGVQLFDNARLFFALSVIKFILDAIGEEVTFKDEIETMLAEHHQVPISKMGFPNGWEKLLLWRDSE